MDFNMPSPGFLHRFGRSQLRQPDHSDFSRRFNNMRLLIIGAFALILFVALVTYKLNESYADSEQPSIDAQIWTVENDMEGAKIRCDKSIRQYLNDVQCRVTKDGKEILLSCDRSRPAGAHCQRDDGNKVIIIDHDTHFSHPSSSTPFPR